MMTSPPSVGTVDSLAPIWKGVGNMAAILEVISFILGKIPANKDNTQSMMRVCVGLNSDELTDAGGNCPDIRLFNEIHDFVAKKPDPGYVSEGDFIDVIIDQGDVQQPTSALITANGAGNGKNGVCLAYLQSTWPDNQTFAWIGNRARHCGEHW